MEKEGLVGNSRKESDRVGSRGFIIKTKCYIILRTLLVFWEEEVDRKKQTITHKFCRIFALVEILRGSSGLYRDMRERDVWKGHNIRWVGIFEGILGTGKRSKKRINYFGLFLLFAQKHFNIHTHIHTRESCFFHLSNMTGQFIWYAISFFCFLIEK